MQGPACPIDFKGTKTWTNLSPKIGLSYRYADDTLVYAHWTRGFRSGGYNLRNTHPDIFGLELEGSLALTRDLMLRASVGYLDTEYTTVRFDLNRDNAVDRKDEALEPPRAPIWTYSLSLLHTVSIGSRYRLVSRVGYAYRDKEYNTDSNLGFNRQLKLLKAGLDCMSTAVSGWSACTPRTCWVRSGTASMG